MSPQPGSAGSGSRRSRPSLRLGLRVASCASLALAVSAAWGQGRGLTLTPGFSATQVFTDNRDASLTEPRSEAITVLSPSLRLAARGARSQASLDYALNGLIYARERDANEVQNALRASLSAELWPEHLFFQAQAGIGQQTISALGGFSEPRLGTGVGAGNVGGISPGVDRNRTEVRTLSLSPSLRGRPFGQANFNLGLSASWTDSAGDGRGDASSQAINASLADGSGPLGWAVFGTRSVSDFRQGRKTTSDSAGLRLNYNPWPELSLFVTGGVQRNDVRTVDPLRYDTWGAGLNWRPGPRTQVGVQTSREFFGDAWSLNVSHRLRRAVFSYGDTRNVTGSTAGQLGSASTYDLFFQQFASLEPDPDLRDILVRNFLQASGLDPDQRINTGFLIQALSVQRARNLALSMSGRRTNVVLSVFASATRRLDRISTGVDDLSSVDLLRQYGASASVSHRLSPSSALVLSGGAQRTRTGDAATGSGIKFASLTWTGNLGPRTGASLSARHATASGVRPYDVNSLYATLNYRF